MAETDKATVELDLVQLGPNDYERAKSVLNKARHPGFVGRELFFRCATTGSATIGVLDGKDVGVALIAKGKLQALSVVPAARGRNVGSVLMQRLAPQWVQAIEERVTFFERLGYVRVGPAKPGQNGKMAVQLMQLQSAPEAQQITAPKPG